MLLYGQWSTSDKLDNNVTLEMLSFWQYVIFTIEIMSHWNRFHFNNVFILSMSFSYRPLPRIYHLARTEQEIPFLQTKEIKIRSGLWIKKSYIKIPDIATKFERVNMDMNFSSVIRGAKYSRTSFHIEPFQNS